MLDSVLNDFIQDHPEAYDSKTDSFDRSVLEKWLDNKTYWLERGVGLK